MSDLTDRKKQLRKEMIAARDAMTKEQRKEKSLSLCGNISSLPAWQNAKVLLGFASFGSEADMDNLLLQAFTEEKAVYLPRVEGDDMRFYRIQSLQELGEGYRGIREPKPDQEKALDPAELCMKETLILIPGVVFDRSGGRIGYGKGFYDRFLAGIIQAHGKEAVTGSILAAAFSLQLAQESTVPMEERDIRIPVIVTENGVSMC